MVFLPDDKKNETENSKRIANFKRRLSSLIAETASVGNFPVFVISARARVKLDCNNLKSILHQIFP